MRQKIETEVIVKASSILAMLLEKSVLVPIALFVCNAIPALSQVRECPAVNCDCENIANYVWRAECREYQALLRKSCVANQGKPTAYCRLHGPKGYPVALSSRYSAVELISSRSEIEKLEKAIEIKNWSAQSDLEAANAARLSRNYAAVLYALKHYEQIQADIVDLRRQVSESLVALGEADEATKLWKKAMAAMTGQESNLVDLQQQQAESEWALMQTPELDSKNRQLLQSLAMRRLRNAGSHLERMAEVYAKAGDTATAARQMQQAAGLAELLLKWAVEAQKKPAFINYYRHQTAARWHSAANYWMHSEASDKASLALREAQRLLVGVDASSVADL